MIRQQLKGTGVALVTPFTGDLSVDTKALNTLVNEVIEKGVEYLVVLGTTAETATLSQEEKALVKSTITQANQGRVPMVLGIGGNNTLAVAEEIKSVDLSDYVAVLSVSPYYNKPTQEGIYQHYKYLSEITPIPIIAYNVPGRTGTNITAETTLRIANDCPNIIGIKEAAGNMAQTMQLLQNRPKDFLVISGDDMLAMPTTLLGGDGVISVLGQGLPEKFSTMIRYALEKDTQKATDLHWQLMDLYQLIFKEGNPAGIKALLKLKGLGNGKVRLPLVQASDNLIKMIEKALKIIFLS